MEDNLHIFSKLDYHIYISYIINNKEQIKDIDTPFDNKIINNTILSLFNITSYDELVSTVIYNNLIRTSISVNYYPSYKILNNTIKTFENIFNVKLHTILLHLLSNTSDNYLLFCVSQWSKQKNINLDEFFEKNDIETIKILSNNESINLYLTYFNAISFPEFNCNQKWSLCHFPYYYEKSKIFSLGFMYQDMGWYYVLSVSLLDENKEKPFFFRLDGGSSGNDQEANSKFFKTHQPDKKIMFTFEETLDIMENNKIDKVLHKL